MEKYELLEKIGQGSYGAVFKARDRTTDNIVAAKLMKEEPGSRSARQEITILKEVQHPNVVALLEEVREEGCVYVIMECFPMNLAEKLHSLPKGQMLEPRLVKSYMHQLTDAIMHCHLKNIMHRDIKPSNLLVNAEGIIKVADFGLACSYTRLKWFNCSIGTRPYMAPEMLLGCRTYSCEVDIWAIGCTFAEMAYRKILFVATTNIFQLFIIFSVLRTPTEESWPGVNALPYYRSSYPRWKKNKLANRVPTLDQTGIDLLQKCLEYNPASRITAKDILAHKYFEGGQNTQAPSNN